MTEDQILTEEQKNALIAIDITEEFNQISKDLDKFHSIFYQIWEMGYPRLTFDVPTAAVSFDKKGNRIDFMFNPSFWKNSDTYTKQFVICHECLHVILNHGIRIKDLPKGSLWQKISNISLDVVVNHMLVDKFNFDRLSIKNQEKYCWIDTVFENDHQNVERNRSFEYYFGLLKSKVKEDLKSCKLFIQDSNGNSSPLNSDTVDVHDFLDDLEDEDLKKEIQDQINQNINDFDKNNFLEKINQTEEGRISTKETNNKEAGSIAGNIKFKMDIFGKVKKKPKWETVIKKWSLKFLKEDQDVEQWTKQNRRISGFSSNLLLPSDIDEDNFSQDRIEVWFFQDISGSCVHLKDRFFKAARSLPPDRFIVKLFSFDTKVREVDIKKGELIGGGGTSFSVIESFIQSSIKKNNQKYPNAVFIITDGYGNLVAPQFPNKWYFFLSENYKKYIPSLSNSYLLKDFE